jgi:ketosteroid isomerase-like protein
MTESNVELARRGYEAVFRGDLDVIAGILAPDVKWHGGDPTAVGACQNRTQALEAMRGAIEQGNIGELVDVVGRDDKVVVILRPPHEPGAPARLVANLTTFRDGRVVEMVHYPDPDDALAAAGLMQH